MKLIILKKLCMQQKINQENIHTLIYESHLHFQHNFININYFINN
jgi:hypothetical protein